MGKASKRQQRARDQLRELGFSNQAEPSLRTQELDESEEDSDAEPSRSHFSAAVNTFASLDDEDQPGEDSQEEDAQAAEIFPLPKTSGTRKKAKSKKKTKNKSSNLASSLSLPVPDSVDQSSIITPEPAVKSSSGTPIGVDEIDKALKELGLAEPTDIEIESGPSSDSRDRAETFSRICSVDCKMLDSDQELRRMFGSRVISSALTSARSSPTPYHPRISNNPHHQVNLRSKTSMLARAQPTWPRFDKESAGLGMRALSSQEKKSIPASCPQEIWFTFEHSPRFKAAQSKFIQAIMSHDPNRLMPIFQSSPYHPDTLLQLSDVSGQQGDPGQSLDFLNRALFSFEKSFSPLFNLSKGLVRLDFSRVENRGFYRAIEKSMQLLAKRGCWRTAFETCKLLLALDPYQDPYGALLWIDFLAPKAKQYQYFIDLSRDYPGLSNHINGIPVTEYPGFAYATALCMWHLEEENNQSHETSSQALQSAIVQFPQVICPLGTKLGLSVPTSFSTLERALPRQGFVDGPGHIIHLQSHIYVNRSGDLWKEPGVLNWIETAISKCHPRLDDLSDPDVILGQKYTRSNFSTLFMMGIYRTVVASDIQALKVFLSPAYLQSTSYSFDPLPPSGSTYDQAYFNDAAASTDAQQALGQLQVGAGAGAQAGQGPFRDLFNQILMGMAGIEGQNPQRVQERVQQLQLALLADDGTLSPDQREALLDLLGALLLQLHGDVDSDEEDVDDGEDIADDLPPADHHVRVGHADADASEEEMTGQASEVVMPGAFGEENSSDDDEPRADGPGMIDTLRRWIGQR